jgi:hypothetical protein
VEFAEHEKGRARSFLEQERAAFTRDVVLMVAKLDGYRLWNLTNNGSCPGAEDQRCQNHDQQAQPAHGYVTDIDPRKFRRGRAAINLPNGLCD